MIENIGRYVTSVNFAFTSRKLIWIKSVLYKNRGTFLNWNKVMELQLSGMIRAQLSAFAGMLSAECRFNYSALVLTVT